MDRNLTLDGFSGDSSLNGCDDLWALLLPTEALGAEAPANFIEQPQDADVGALLVEPSAEGPFAGPHDVYVRSPAPDPVRNHQSGLYATDLAGGPQLGQWCPPSAGAPVPTWLPPEANPGLSASFLHPEPSSLSAPLLINDSRKHLLYGQAAGASFSADGHRTSCHGNPRFAPSGPHKRLRRPAVATLPSLPPDSFSFPASRSTPNLVAMTPAPGSASWVPVALPVAVPLAGGSPQQPAALFAPMLPRPPITSHGELARALLATPAGAALLMGAAPPAAPSFCSSASTSTSSLQLHHEGSVASSKLTLEVTEAINAVPVPPPATVSHGATVEGLLERGRWFLAVTSLEPCARAGITSHAALLHLCKALLTSGKRLGDLLHVTADVAASTVRSCVARWPLHTSPDYHRASVWLAQNEGRYDVFFGQDASAALVNPRRKAATFVRDTTVQAVVLRKPKAGLGRKARLQQQQQQPPFEVETQRLSFIGEAGRAAVLLPLPLPRQLSTELEGDILRLEEETLSLEGSAPPVFGASWLDKQDAGPGVGPPAFAGAGGDFKLPGLGLVVDGSLGYTMWVATDQVAHHGVAVPQPRGLAVSSAVFTKWSVAAEMLPREDVGRLKQRVVQQVPRDPRGRGVQHWDRRRR